MLHCLANKYHNDAFKIISGSSQFLTRFYASYIVTFCEIFVQSAVDLFVVLNGSIEGSLDCSGRLGNSSVVKYKLAILCVVFWVSRWRGVHTDAIETWRLVLFLDLPLSVNSFFGILHIESTSKCLGRYVVRAKKFIGVCLLVHVQRHSLRCSLFALSTVQFSIRCWGPDDTSLTLPVHCDWRMNARRTECSVAGTRLLEFLVSKYLIAGNGCCSFLQCP